MKRVSESLGASVITLTHLVFTNNIFYFRGYFFFVIGQKEPDRWQIEVIKIGQKKSRGRMLFILPVLSFKMPVVYFVSESETVKLKKKRFLNKIKH